MAMETYSLSRLPADARRDVDDFVARMQSKLDDRRKHWEDEQARARLNFHQRLRICDDYVERHGRSR